MGIAFKTDFGQVEVPLAQDQVVQNFTVEQKELTSAFIHGQVLCGSDPVNPNSPVEEAVVKAVNTADENIIFYALTDEDGFYALCVPPGTYDLLVYCCPEGSCIPGPCTCGCQTP